MPFEINTAVGDGLRRGGSTPASNIEGVATNFLQGAVSGIPLVGGLASGLVGLASGLVGGTGTPYGSTEFDGLHSPSLPRLEASSMKAPEASTYRLHAQGLGISVEEVDKLLHLDASNTGHDFAYVLDAYRAGNQSPEILATWIPIYNSQNPTAQITRGVKGPAGVLEPTSTAQQHPGNPATQPFVQPQQNTTKSDTPAEDKTTTYALIGGGALAVIILLILLLKK